MAASLLLRRGPSAALKTVLREARVCRGLASTVSLSAESGKTEKGLPPNSKRQSPPKNVVEPKERGKPLATPAAAELSKNLSSPSSYPVVNPGGRVAGPRPSPEDSVLFTDKGVPEFLSRKTLVEFPQKVLPPFRKQGSASRAAQENRGGADGSSSSSSGSSDSESDEDGGGATLGPRVTSRGRGGLPKPQASRSLENGAPRIAASTKEKPRSQQGQPDPSPPERPRQAKKKGAPVKPLEDRKDTKPRTTAPGLHADKELMKQNVKEKQMGKILRSSEKEKESPKPLEVKKASPDHVTSGLSTQPAASSTPVTSGLSTQLAASPVPSSEASRAGGQLQAPPETRDGRLEKQVLERDGEGAFPPVGREGSGERIMGGVLQAREEALGDRSPLKPPAPPSRSIIPRTGISSTMTTPRTPS
ncbi:NADH dehydrogenase [ubiquinone] flavoprotein 3, mitochondrial isoform X2 [Mustela erminea]|uniref:NADH dehydrogenase [ubiquinone] flavoprotein 3, mitochondrial isoform X2 n=1 Tax=Mustela erminea TaxID=36723 RepID=UPI0013870C3C|nr:NADH dehydrogenase [ubiquinone] flavoprotein 3, mitochondrial isoform X2 [Mustela erminea]